MPPSTIPGNTHKNTVESDPCFVDTEVEVQKGSTIQIRLNLDLYGLGSDPTACLLS